jgi:hypothetical protein
MDTPLDVAMELIAKQSVMLPANVGRAWFNKTAATVMMAAIEEAKGEDRLRDLFDGAEPSRVDLEMTARLLSEIATSDNCRLQARCMEFVLELTTESQTEIAAAEGVGRAAVSKRCIRICEALGLPPSRGMKKEKTRAVYADRQRGKRSRPAREPWAFMGMLGGIYGV